MITQLAVRNDVLLAAEKGYFADLPSPNKSDVEDGVELAEESLMAEGKGEW